MNSSLLRGVAVTGAAAISGTLFLTQGAGIVRERSGGSEFDPATAFAADQVGTRALPSVSIDAVDPSTVNEGEETTLIVTVEDPDPGNTLTMEIDWGDGRRTNSFELPSGSTTVERSHTYADDRPSGTPSDVWTITATVSDRGGNRNDNHGGREVSATTEITVNNVDPTVTITNATSPVDAGRRAKVRGTIEDPGTGDRFRVVVDWGDGRKPSRVRLDNRESGVKKFRFRHKFRTADGSPFTVTATAIDDDTGEGSDTTVIEVTP